MERETKEIITPIGQNKIVLKLWLTGQEKRRLTSVFLDAAMISLECTQAVQ